MRRFNQNADWNRPNDAMPDVRYALRLLRRQPMFACLVIGTLMLGIGASTTMFAVVNGVLLKPLPYPNPATLVWMFGAFRLNDSAAVSPPDFIDYRERNDVFQRLGAMTIAPGGVTVTGSGTPERLRASRVSAELMTTLGVAPLLGRDFTRNDETSGSMTVIVSHRLWQERLGGAGDVLGRSLVVDGRARTIVGVMPAGFTLPYDSFIRLTEPVDLYLPIPFDDAEARIRRFHYLRVIGRLGSPDLRQQAQSEMDVIARQLAATYSENETWHLRLVPLRERIVGGTRPVLLILMAAVMLLLLVACANVASLLLARGGGRAPELALRTALGASRTRLVRQLLVEGLALSAAGGAAGLVVTWWMIHVLKRIGPARFPRLEAVGLDIRVVAFALAAAVLTTLIFALAPALHATRKDLASAIRRGRGDANDRSHLLGQRALVVTQLSVSVVLLAGAALLVRSFTQLISVETGFTAAGVTLAQLPLPSERYGTDAKIEAFYSALLERLEATPGVEAAALATMPPLAGANDSVVYREGEPPATTADRRFAQVRWIQGNYFGALGIPLLAGRGFDAQIDRAGAPGVVMISQRLSREYFGNASPIGQRLVVDLGAPVAATVIGVTADVRVFGQASEAPAILYLHAKQHPSLTMHTIVKSSAATADVGTAIRRHVLALDPALAISRTEQMAALVADSVAEPRFSMLLIGSFACLAAMLTLIGLYGTLAYMVSERRREFGIRLALGATAGDIRRMVLRQGAAIVAIGTPIGLGASLFTSRLASALVSDLRPPDAVVLAFVAGLLASLSLVATLIPAQRAARIEPLVAIRAE
jgi:putative ABC transport system permease protein